MLWLSSQTRPDLCYDTLAHSTLSKNAQIKDLLTLNKAVKKVKDGPKWITFNKLNLDKEKFKIIFYSDASLGNLPNRKDSGRGYVIFLVNDQGKACVLAWSSSKIKRVVHSVFSAETLGCVDAVSASIYVRHILSEILYNDAHSDIIDIVGFTDSNQLQQQIYSTKQCLEARMRLDVAELQETIETGIVNKILWTPTSEMLADCLTKQTACSKKLNDVLETGILPLFCTK